MKFPDIEPCLEQAEAIGVRAREELARRTAKAAETVRIVALATYRIITKRVYRPRKRHKPIGQVVSKLLETTLKCALILMLAAIPAICVAWFWHRALFTHHLHFGKEVREVLITAWIPTFGVIYALLAGVAVNWVANEYKEMRMAVKRRDIERFMILQDEDLSPLMHSMITIIAFAVLGGFMGIEYPDATSGLIVVGGATYVFSLLCMVVIEIDHPCGGIWVIKNIPPEWLDVDPRAWRNQHFTVTVSQTTSVTVEMESPTSTDTRTLDDKNQKAA